MIRRTTAVTAILGGILLCGASTSEAQSNTGPRSTGELGRRVSQGDRLTVIEKDHRVSFGVLVGSAGSSLSLLGDGVVRDIAVGQIAEVRKDGDSVWNGFLIGAVVGAAIGFGTFEECEPEPPATVCGGNLTKNRGMETAVAAALFGSIGLGVDLLHQGTSTVYRAADPTPKGRVAVRVTATPAEVAGRVAVRF